MKKVTPIVLTNEQYQKLINPGHKQKRRKTKRDPPLICEECGERITGEQSVCYRVDNGHPTPYHYRCRLKVGK